MYFKNAPISLIFSSLSYWHQTIDLHCFFFLPLLICFPSCFPFLSGVWHPSLRHSLILQTRLQLVSGVLFVLSSWSFLVPSFISFDCSAMGNHLVNLTKGHYSIDLKEHINTTYDTNHITAHTNPCFVKNNSPQSESHQNE